MLTSIQLREEDNTTLLHMPVGRPSSSRYYFIKKAEGLGPVPADVTVSPYATQDGGVFQASRVGTRNIVLTLGFKPNYKNGKTIEVLKEDLYKFFPPRRAAYLVFIKDELASTATKITGFVESLEISQFSKDPEAQISIVCPDPYIVDYYPMTIEATTEVSIDTSVFGSAPTGFLFDITFNRNVGRLYIEAFGQTPMDLSGDFTIGDRLRVSTVTGNKYIIKNRNGTGINELNTLVGGSLNTFVDSRTKSFVARFSSGGSHPYTLWYTPRYVGVS